LPLKSIPLMRSFSSALASRLRSALFIILSLNGSSRDLTPTQFRPVPRSILPLDPCLETHLRRRVPSWPPLLTPHATHPCPDIDAHLSRALPLASLSRRCHHVTQSKCCDRLPGMKRLREARTWRSPIQFSATRNNPRSPKSLT
jgi:hypothetical protein